MKIEIKKLTMTALLIALCVVGANIKFLGSIALDSFPAFVGTLLLGPLPGALLGFLGHMVSALLAGFPSTLPVHLIIGVFMAICMLVYGYLHKLFFSRKLLSSVLASVGAYLINVPLALLCLYPILGKAVFALYVPLTVSTVINLFLAEVVVLAIPVKYKERIISNERG